MTVSSSSVMPGQVVVVCLGNICRSPLAALVLQEAIHQAGLNIKVTSAGTAGYHQGKPADARSVSCAARHGLNLSGHRAQQLTVAMAQTADEILVMDNSNLRDVQHLLGQAQVTTPVSLFTAQSPAGAGLEVADPYYGTVHDFQQVYAQCQTAAKGWVRYWQGESDVRAHD